ncbi:hypothetical protein VE04_09283 [Pseudogymnoascus sp. 24MN13]|nr:hypothetical protein VE04_09283 [Pseudogymnoascus sp. 24MN13]
MDPLSITATIIAIVQLTGVIIECLNDLKDTSKDLSSNDGWYGEVQALAAANGPIDQYRSALEQLKSKFTSSASSRTKIGSALSWKFSKEEVANILMRIERLKSLTQIALEMGHFKLSQALKIDTTVITNTVRSLQENQVSKQYRVITDWLSSTDFLAQQSDFIGRRQEGTGEWFVVSPEFTNWLQGATQDLFCPGIPGAGKTMIAAIAVDHVWKAFQGDNVGIAYIYCNYKRREAQTTIDLLATILKQLVQERPLYGEPVTSLHALHVDRRTRPSLNEICTALNSVLNNYSKTYIIIDALDECTDSDGTRSELLAVLRNLQAKTDTRLMVTSRFVSRIEQSFEGSPMLEIRASEADVKRYVAGQLHRLPMCVQRDPELQTETQGGIVLAVDGMFLLARLHVDSLRGKTTKKAVRATLKKLPRGSTALNEAYDEAIERIESQLPEESELAKTVLSWITYAVRQLTTKELSHALAVEAGESELDEDNIPDIEDVISVCAGLVTVDEESDVIRLVHYTTQEYFERVREVWNPKAQEEIVSTCLTYLSFQTFSNGRCNSDAEFESRISQNPFLDYAARYWGTHALPVQQAVKEPALSFLCNMNQLACSNQVLFLTDYTYDGYSQSTAKNQTGLHVAAVFGMAYLLQELMPSDGNKDCMHIDAQDSSSRDDVVVDSKDTEGWTPLSWAARTGNEAIVELLLKRDDVVADLTDNDDRAPLSWAAEGGHEAVVKLLVKRDDVKANLGNSAGGRTPLSFGAEGGNEAVVKLLLERDDVVADSMDYRGRTPLSIAAEAGHEGIVKLLVERDDVVADSKNAEGRTPLSWAAEAGEQAIIRQHAAIRGSEERACRSCEALIERDDVVINAEDVEGRTPLIWAASRGHEAVVHLLTERGDIIANFKDNDGWTALSFAAEAGHDGIVKLLVERDDVIADLKGNKGRTPLAVAAEMGREAVVKLLIERDDVVADSKDNMGRTPLSLAAGNMHGEVVKLLLEQDDVDPNSKDNNGCTPLWWAADGSPWLLGSARETTVELLLERGTIPDSKDQDGRTPLSIAAERLFEGVVKLLLKRNDVDPNSKDKDGHTPLWWAVHSEEDIWFPTADDRRKPAERREAIVKLLTDRIADDRKKAQTEDHITNI